MYQEIYNLQLKDQEQFQREMLCLDDAGEPEADEPEAEAQPKAARPDTHNKPEADALRPSAVK